MSSGFCRFIPWLMIVVCCSVVLAYQGDATVDPRKEPKALPSRVFLYGSRVKNVSLDELKKLMAGPGTVRITKGEPDNWSEIVVQFGDRSLTIDRKADREFLEPHLDGLTGYIFQRLAEGKMDSDVFHLMRQVSRTVNTYGVSASEKTIQGPPARFLSRLARLQNSVIFDGTGLLDPDLQILLGPKKQRDSLAQLPSFPSAVDRKARTMAALKKRGLKPFAGLPTIVTNEEVRIYSAEQVARRCLCLLAVAAHSEDADKIEPVKFLKQYGAWESASPEEQRILQNKELSAEEKSTLTWRYESLTALLWSINKLDSIRFPDTQSDAAAAITAVMENTEDFVKTAKLRPAKEILDQADLVYRSFWLVRDARINGKSLDGLDGSVVYERHYALCWLLRYLNRDWDDVQPDS